MSETVFTSRLTLSQLADQLAQLLGVHFEQDREGTFEEFDAYRSTAFGLEVDLLRIGDGLYQLSVVPHSNIDITVGQYEQTDISLWLKKVLGTSSVITLLEHK